MSIKKDFSQYFNPSNDSFRDIWENSAIVFDTSALLKLYEIAPVVASEFLAGLEKIKDKIWMPNQVALEFSRNRLSVISKQLQPYDKICSFIDQILIKIESDFPTYPDHPFLNKVEILKKIKSNIKKVKRNVKENKPIWHSDDFIANKIDEIYDDNIGLAYDDNKIIEICEDGERRYGKGIPPGYMDVKKDETDKSGLDKFGDLIIWLQMIDFSKSCTKPIIFVTADRKEDWWWRTDDDRELGPRPELRKEFYDKTGQVFYMYRVENFISNLKKMLSINIDQKVVKELKRVLEKETKISFEDALVKKIPKVQFDGSTGVNDKSDEKYSVREDRNNLVKVKR